MFCCVIVNTVELVNLIGMCKTDCCGEARLVPSSSRAGNLFSCYLLLLITQTMLCHVGLLFAGYVAEFVLGSLVIVTYFLLDQEHQCCAT